MSFLIHPSKLSGTITLPPSKSHTLRALIFALMASGTSKIHNYLDSPDTDAMVEAIVAFGATVEIEPGTIVVIGTAGKLLNPTDEIDAQNSGQVLRFIAAIAGLIDSKVVITGDKSIQTNRPIKPLLQALNQLGCLAKSILENDFAPVEICGPITNSFAQLSGEDSQPVSALLIALSFFKQKSILEVTNPGEKPWIDLTLFWLNKFNIKVKHTNYQHYEIEGFNKIKSFEVDIPGDLSSASYPIAAAVITNSKIVIQNIDLNDVQGDKKFVSLLKQMGAQFEISEKNKTLSVKKSKSLVGIDVNLNDCIDLITILPVVACFATSKTTITGAQIARSKECDRISSITSELNKMGATITELEDGLIIYPSTLHGANLNSYFDHRMSLAMSVASLGAKTPSKIEGTQCINKTYKNFKQDFQKLGAKIL